MSVLFKALQRAERVRGNQRGESVGQAQRGMPAVGAGTGGDRDRSTGTARPDRGPPLSTGRRVARLLGILVIAMLAAVAAGLYLYGDEVEMLLADSLGGPAPRVAAPPAPPPAPTSTATDQAAPDPVPTPPAAAAPRPAAVPAEAEAPPDDTAADTTNIAALMDAGRRNRTAAETTPRPAPTAAATPTEAPPAEPAEPVEPPAPRSLEDVLDAQQRADGVAALKPPVAVERPGVRRAGAPEAEVEVQRQTAEVRNGVETAYRALMRGDYTTALSLYDSVLTEEPGSLPALLGRAAALHKLRRLDEARAAYEAVLGREPANREALTNLADIIAVTQPADALGRLLDLHRRAPDFGPVSAQIALLYARMDRLPEAVGYMQRAVRVEPRNALYRYNLAILQDRAGDRAGAAESYRHVLDAMSAGATIGVPREAVRDRLRFLTSPAR